MDNLEGDSPSPPQDVKPTVAKGKPTQAKRKGRKAVKKKPDDMPRRPLSAYNFFFSVRVGLQRDGRTTDSLLPECPFR